MGGRPNGCGHIHGGLNRLPGRVPLGTMPRDPIVHFLVPGLSGRDVAHGITAELRCELLGKRTLAAAGSTGNKNQLRACVHSRCIEHPGRAGQY